MSTKFNVQKMLAALLVSTTCIVFLHLNLFTTILWVCLVLVFYDVYVEDQDQE